ncbi:MAG TPA: cell division protein SepF [Thermaerobacter sp.]
MGWMDRLLSLIGFEVEEEVVEPDPAEAAESEPPAVRRRESRGSRGPEPTGRTARGGQLVPLAGNARTQRVVIARPRTFEEVQEVAEHLKNRRPLILNLEDTDKDTAQRILNFLSGTIYALNGEMHRIASGVVFFAPQNVETVVDREFLQRD